MMIFIVEGFGLLLRADTTKPAELNAPSTTTDGIEMQRIVLSLISIELCNIGRCAFQKRKRLTFSLVEFIYFDIRMLY